MRRWGGIGAGSAAVLLMISAACGVAGPVATYSNAAGDQCPTFDGLPVVWWARDELIGDRIVNSRLADTGAGTEVTSGPKSIVSSYWAKTPNAMVHLHPDARACVPTEHRWVVEVTAADLYGERWPDAEPSTLSLAPPAELWDRVTLHPWRLAGFGPIGAATTEPDYGGVVLFSDQIATLTSVCDERSYVLRFRGDVVFADEWPPSEQTMVCSPPPGIEAPDNPESLPIAGRYSMDGDTLVVTNGDVEYRYERIANDEFVAEFDRETFWHIPDPLADLRAWEAESFAELDNPTTPVAVTTTSVGGGDG